MRLTLSLLRLLTIAAAMLASPLCRAQEATPSRPLIADLSNRLIEVDSHFNGTRLLLFGARNANGDIVVAVRGPQKDIVIRKKERVAGIWVNRDERRFPQVPMFYSIAASRPLEEIRNPYLFNPLGLGLEQAVPRSPDPEDALRQHEFAGAFLRHQQRAGLYASELSDVSFLEETLFKTSLPFPDNTPHGNYTAEVYLFSDGQLVSMESTPITVKRIGFDAFLYNLAHEVPVAYGLLAVLVAMISGWSAGRLFEKL